MIENALASGICSMGADVVLVGPLPTPGIRRDHGKHAGRRRGGHLRFHNPFQDQRIKIFSSDGFKLPDEMEARIEKLILENNYPDFKVTAERVGKAFRLTDATGRYVMFLKQAFPRELFPGRAEDRPGLRPRRGLQGRSGRAWRNWGPRWSASGSSPTATTSTPVSAASTRTASPRWWSSGGWTWAWLWTATRTGPSLWTRTAKWWTATTSWPSAPKDMLNRNELKKRTLVATVMSNLGLEKAAQRDGRPADQDQGGRPLRGRGDA